MLRGQELDDVVTNALFMLAVSQEPTDLADPSFREFCHVLSDMFSSHFGLTREHHRLCKQHLMSKTLSIKELFRMYDQYNRNNNNDDDKKQER